MSAQHKAGIDTYTVNDLCRKLGLSRLQVFEIISMNVFRSIHVKGCTRISKPSFDSWFEEYSSNPALMMRAKPRKYKKPITFIRPSVIEEEDESEVDPLYMRKHYEILCASIKEDMEELRRECEAKKACEIV